MSKSSPHDLEFAVRQQVTCVLEERGFENPEDTADLFIKRVASQINDKLTVGTFASMLKEFIELEFLRQRAPEEIARKTPLIDGLRHLLQTRFPVLYTQVLEPTLADLREEHSAALAEGCPLKARCALLQGCGALAAAAACQLGYSLLGRIAALWKARSPK